MGYKSLARKAPGKKQKQCSQLGPYLGTRVPIGTHFQNWVLIFSQYTHIFKSTCNNAKMGLKLMIIETTNPV